MPDIYSPSPSATFSSAHLSHSWDINPHLISIDFVLLHRFIDGGDDIK